MLKGEYVISSREYLKSIMNQLGDAVDDHGFIKVSWTAGSNRSLPQLALFWMWMGEMSTEFNRRGKTDEYNKDFLHDVLCNRFLGDLTYTVGKTTITRMKSLRDLDKGEMHFFMEQVSSFAIEHGVMLTYPADSEYMKLVERQNK